MPITTSSIQHKSVHNEDKTNQLWKKAQQDGREETKPPLT